MDRTPSEQIFSHAFCMKQENKFFHYKEGFGYNSILTLTNLVLILTYRLIIYTLFNGHLSGTSGFAEVELFHEWKTCAF